MRSGKRDVLLSTSVNPERLFVNIQGPSITDSEKNASLYELQDDNCVDSGFRTSIISLSEEEQEITTLKEIWDTLGKRPSSLVREQSESSGKILSFKVRFDDGRDEHISLNSQTYVRTIDGTSVGFCLVENLENGQTIAYVRSDDLETLDHLFIRDFSDSRGWMLEDVFMPSNTLQRGRCST